MLEWTVLVQSSLSAWPGLMVKSGFSLTLSPNPGFAAAVGKTAAARFVFASRPPGVASHKHQGGKRPGGQTWACWCLLHVCTIRVLEMLIITSITFMRSVHRWIQVEKEIFSSVLSFIGIRVTGDQTRACLLHVYIVLAPLAVLARTWWELGTSIIFLWTGHWSLWNTGCWGWVAVKVLFFLQ